MKWISPLINIKIGLKILAFVLLTFVFACGNKYKLPDIYRTRIHNNTDSPLVIQFKERMYGYDTLGIKANDYVDPVELFPTIFKRVSISSFDLKWLYIFKCKKSILKYSNSSASLYGIADKEEIGSIGIS